MFTSAATLSLWGVLGGVLVATAKLVTPLDSAVPSALLCGPGGVLAGAHCVCSWGRCVGAACKHGQSRNQEGTTVSGWAAGSCDDCHCATTAPNHLIHGVPVPQSGQKGTHKVEAQDFGSLSYLTHPQQSSKAALPPPT